MIANKGKRHAHNAVLLHKIFVKIVKVLIPLTKSAYNKSTVKEELAKSGGICGLYRQFVKELGNDVYFKSESGRIYANKTTFPEIAKQSQMLFGKCIVNPNKTDEAYFWKPHIFVKKGKLVGIKIRIKFLKGALNQLVTIVNKQNYEKTTNLVPEKTSAKPET